jgi:hypothetical protein
MKISGAAMIWIDWVSQYTFLPFPTNGAAQNFQTVPSDPGCASGIQIEVSIIRVNHAKAIYICALVLLPS